MCRLQSVPINQGYRRCCELFVSTKKCHDWNFILCNGNYFRRVRRTLIIYITLPTWLDQLRQVTDQTILLDETSSGKGDNLFSIFFFFFYYDFYHKIENFQARHALPSQNFAVFYFSSVPLESKMHSSYSFVNASQVMSTDQREWPTPSDGTRKTSSTPCQEHDATHTTVSDSHR